MDDKITSNYIKKFHCKKCDFKCCKQGDWNRHLSTRKHQKDDKWMTNDDVFTSITSNFTSPHTSVHTTYDCECGNTYKYRQGLHKHHKTCSIHQGTMKAISSMSTNNDIDKEVLIKMLLKNQDVMEKMIEIMPSIGNNSHNNTNSHNTQNFNIQMFLNDHCKNAMNLTDFIDTLPITAETYDNTIANGLTSTITKMLVTGLSQLDILERPIHCTDASRKTLYVKDDNVWEKDEEVVKILMGIRKLTSKQRTQINKWKDVNDGWKDTDNIQTKFTTLICNSMNDIENDVKATNKIIRSLSKTVYLDNEVKNMYLE